jgi:hypothetical protein
MNSRKYLSSQTKNIINYIADTIDAITDQICIRVPSIPMTIRVYCKALYDLEIKKGNTQTQAQRVIAYYLIEKWLAQVAFSDMVIYGFTKTYYLK